MNLPHPLAALALAAALLHAPAPGRASPPPGTSQTAVLPAHRGWAELERIAAGHGATTAYRARFKQEKFSPLLRDPIVSHGTVRMDGGVARWDTDPPHASTVLMDGQALRVYYPQQRILEIYPLAGGLGGPALAALATSPVPDLAVLRKHFSLDTWALSPDRRHLVLTLVPRSEDMTDALEGIRVEVGTDTGHLHRFALTDLDGETTAMTFFNAEPHADLDPDALTFTSPPGTTVVRPLGTVSP